MTDPQIVEWTIRLWDKFRVEEFYEELKKIRVEMMETDGGEATPPPPKPSA